LKTLTIQLITVIIIISINSCQNLDIEPINILTSKQVFEDQAAINAYMASLYDQAPWEDHNSSSYYSKISNKTDESIGTVETQTQTILGDGNDEQWWGYSSVRNVNDFLEKLEESQLNEEFKLKLKGEALFIRAFYYFGMVKRYGGIPIIDKVQRLTGDNLHELQVARDKEEDVYNFIANDLDEAAELLPVINGKGRATKYGSLALKSRVMLYAASSAKYGNVFLDGIVGISSDKSDEYWNAALIAADAVINSGVYNLYEKNTNKTENFQQLFIDEDNPEAIITKYYTYPGKSHGYHNSNLPFGVRAPTGAGSGIGPTLECVQQFEYIDGSPGKLKIGTPSDPVFYDNPMDLFDNFDPRMKATIIVPFDEWRGTTIDVQAGLYDQGIKVEAGDFSTLYNPITHEKDQQNGTIRIVGRNGLGGSEKTQTGFYIKKYLDYNLSQAEAGQAAQQWIFLRYGEVLLNYAEAAVELGRFTDAKEKINLIRSRAGIVLLNDSEITVDRVRHERLVEFAFERQRFWDYRRWHLSDDLFNNTWVHGIRPYFDIDKNAYRFETDRAGVYPKTFPTYLYLQRIPESEIAKNPNLVQNPLY